MRLAKYLAHAGIASRRASERIIADGRVRVRGQVVTDPARDVDDTVEVTVDGHPITVAEQPRLVYALNKPAGVVSTARDPQGRPTVVDYVNDNERLYPVGRLDVDTTGLILLTNDGDLANRLTHPRYGVEKTYRVKVVKPPVKPDALERLRAGVELDDGMTAPAKVRRVKADTIEITIREGRNRQVRRMVEAVGHRVHSLQRVAFGPLRLGGLNEGQHRRLNPRELESLRGGGD
jgi:23S rRNA pseudouridine2605 synthase